MHERTAGRGSTCAASALNQQYSVLRFSLNTRHSNQSNASLLAGSDGSSFGRRVRSNLCHREQRYVGSQLTFHYDRNQIILEQTELAKGLSGRYVEVYDYFVKPIEVRWQSHILPYHVFNKDQTVRPAEVIENKRLRHALAVVRAKQEQRQAIKIMTNSEKVGYKKRPRVIQGTDYELGRVFRQLHLSLWQTRPSVCPE
jgi:hypothetical protein